MGAEEEAEYAAAADAEESASTNQRTLSLKGWSVPHLPHSSAVEAYLKFVFLICLLSVVVDRLGTWGVLVSCSFSCML